MGAVRLRTAIWHDKQVTLRVSRLAPWHPRFGVQVGHRARMAKSVRGDREPVRDTKASLISCGEWVMSFGAATERTRYGPPRK